MSPIDYTPTREVCSLTAQVLDTNTLDEYDLPFLDRILVCGAVRHEENLFDSVLL